MYTPCLPYTRSDESVHVVDQYTKSFAPTQKSGGGRDLLRCDSFTTNEKRKWVLLDNS